MTPRSVVLRASARRDVDEVVARYLEEAGAQVALGFIDALEGAFRQLADHPDSGSPRYGQELNLPRLRSWPVKAHPHVVFYMMASEVVDVWRVLHGRRDIPAGLRDK
ncbi:MAG: type II toxin-antitoxin system RelE/ParE family toxin [Gammaproteobacteria bacterium]|nr:type II toxin-antitoxin system RelE/ParE family toxin [Gammaproteobacteria bacterium]MDE0256757.1 type II toxin-antitoxin system RelE/ParE family toxin [Gammaproteobacteria bacterium]